MTDPLRELLNDAVGLMHPAFVEASTPASILCEFYHQFRKLWDRGIPVGMGLGHLLTTVVNDSTLAIRRLGEQGAPDEPLATILFREADAATPGLPHTFKVIHHGGRFKLIDVA